MMDHLKLTVDKLSVEVVTELVTDERCGAVSLFVGTTRDNFDGKKVIHLEYEAYEPMALKAMKKLCNNMREKWPDIHGIAIYHRLGRVCVREASVVLAVSSPHRQQSLEAVAYCIEQIKATAPIWKKEMYDDGEHSGAWKQNSECAAKKRKERPSETMKIDKSLIQINVTCEELQKRIQSFVERKRQQVDLSNIRDFIPYRPEGEGEGEGAGEGCARTSAVFQRRSDSKGHLKVHRVNNEWGPQTLRPPAQAQAPGERAAGAALPPGVEERVLQIEKFLNIRSVSPDVYRRLKEMEDRIRHLESVSPEYASFWRKGGEAGCGEAESVASRSMECRYTADEIHTKIEQLEKHNSMSWNTF